jgi:hypothetical protein
MELFVSAPNQSLAGLPEAPPSVSAESAFCMLARCGISPNSITTQHRQQAPISAGLNSFTHAHERTLREQLRLACQYG